MEGLYSLRLIQLYATVKKAVVYWLRATTNGEALIVWQTDHVEFFSTETLKRIKTIQATPERYFHEEKLLLATTQDGYEVYATQDGSLCYTIPGAKEKSYLIMKGSELLTSDQKHTKRWSKDAGEPLYEIEGDISGFNDSNNAGDYFLLLDAQKKISVRSLETGEEIRTFPKLGYISVALSPDGKWLANYGTFGESVDIWEVSTGTKRFSIPSEAENVTFNKDSSSIFLWASYVVNISEDFGYSATEWDLKTGEQKKEVEPTTQTSVPSAKWHKQGSYIYSPDGQRTHLPSDDLCWFNKNGHRYIARIWQETLTIRELCGPSNS